MEWKLEKRKLSDLHERKDNPRKLSKHDAQHLQRSIEKFGLCEPVVLNWNGEIIGGHQRVRTLHKMGYKEVDVYLPDQPLSEEEAKELCIRLNKNSGVWDYDVLANSWQPEELVDWGFQLEELHLEALPGSEDKDEKQKPPQKATMTISFMDAGHLQEAENEIASIVDSFPGANYKVKVN